MNDSPPPAPSHSRLYYGWIIVLIAFCAHFVSTGMGFYSFGVFFKPLAEEFGWTRAQTGAGFMVALVTTSLYAPFIGSFIDRKGARVTMAVGAVLVCAAFILMSRMTELWHYILIFGVLLALANGSMGGLPATASVANWFNRRRGRALGISTMGVSLSGMALPPVAYWLLEETGWRASFQIMSLLPVLVVLPLALLFMRRRPADIGLTVENAPPGLTFPPQRLETSSGIRPREALKSIHFWKITIAFALALFPLGTLLVQQNAFLTDIGIPPATAAYLLSLTAGCGAVGKIVFGFGTDYIEKRFVSAVSFAIQAIGLAVWMRYPSLPGATAFALLFGFGMGGLVPLSAAMRATYFGPRYFGAIAGIAAPFTTVIQAVGQPFSGHVFDVTGAYMGAFYTFLGAYALAIVLILSVRSERYFPDWA